MFKIEATSTIVISAESGKPLCIGREGENNARQVIFDLSRWRAIYGPGTVQLLVQRSGEKEPYPAALTVDGNNATWVITAADTAIPGQFGKAELRYLVGDTLVKSETWTTLVLDALGEPSETPPEAYQGWVDQVLAAGTAAQIAQTETARSAESSAGSAAAAEMAATSAGNSASAAAGSAAAAQTAQTGAETARTGAQDAAATARVQVIAATSAQQKASESMAAAKSSEIHAAASASAATEQADRAETAAIRQPYPDPDTGTWWVWDAESGTYKDTGKSYGGGGVSVEDDGDGNVKITSLPNGWTVTDDGDGNVVIGE